MGAVTAVLPLLPPLPPPPLPLPDPDWVSARGSGRQPRHTAHDIGDNGMRSELVDHGNSGLPIVTDADDRNGRDTVNCSAETAAVRPPLTW